MTTPVPPPIPATPAAATASAEIYDRGYRRYDGPRTGAAGASRSVWVSSVQRALGLRRKFRFKIVPILTILIAYVPAIAFMGIAILLPSEFAREVVADYAGYFSLISIAVILFTAFVAPELMSTDRRTGLLGLYMASPLNRGNYLVAKGSALMSVLMLVTMLPIVFLLVGYSFVDLGPEGFVETLKLLGRIAASGLLMSLFFTLIGMAASTLTNRQGFASAGIVMLLIGSGALAGGLVEGAGVRNEVQLASIAGLPFEVIARIFDAEFEQTPDVSTLEAVGAYAAVCVVSLAVIAWGYRRLEITK
jgi:ABC-2 type transport system permease protein